MKAFRQLSVSDQAQILQSVGLPSAHGLYAVPGFMPTELRELSDHLITSNVDFSILSHIHDERIVYERMPSTRLARSAGISLESAHVAVSLHNNEAFPFKLYGYSLYLATSTKSRFSQTGLGWVTRSTVKWIPWSQFDDEDTYEDAQANTPPIVMSSGPIGSGIMTPHVFQQLAKVRGFDGRFAQGVSSDMADYSDVTVEVSAVYPNYGGIPYVVVKMGELYFGLDVRHGINVVPLPGHMGWRMELVGTTFFVRQACGSFGQEMVQLSLPCSAVPPLGVVLAIGPCDYPIPYLQTYCVRLDHRARVFPPVPPDPARLTGYYDVDEAGTVLGRNYLAHSSDSRSTIKLKKSAFLVDDLFRFTLARRSTDMYDSHHITMFLRSAVRRTFYSSLYTVLIGCDLSRMDAVQVVTCMVAMGHTIIKASFLRSLPRHY